MSLVRSLICGSGQVWVVKSPVAGFGLYGPRSDSDVVFRQQVRAIARSDAQGHRRPDISELHSRVMPHQPIKRYIYISLPNKSDTHILATTMVVIYCGKLTYELYAPSTIITVVAPDGIRDGKPCLIYWQWAVTEAGARNRNKEFTGTFTEKVYPVVECEDSSDVHNWFTWNLRTNTMQLMDHRGNKGGQPIMLEKVYPVGRCGPWC